MGRRAAGSGLSDAPKVVPTPEASTFFTAVPPVSMDFRHPSRSQHDRTRREDRHSKFYEISDNLQAASSESITSSRYSSTASPARRRFEASSRSIERSASP